MSPPDIVCARTVDGFMSIIYWRIPKVEGAAPLYNTCLISAQCTGSWFLQNAKESELVFDLIRCSDHAVYNTIPYQSHAIVLLQGSGIPAHQRHYNIVSMRNATTNVARICAVDMLVK